MKTRLKDTKQSRDSDHVARITAHCVTHYPNLDDLTLIDFAQGIATDCPYHYGVALDREIIDRGTARGLQATEPDTEPTDKETPQ